MSLSHNEKMLVLTKIEEKKHLLFAKFDNKISRDLKRQAWQELFVSCQALGLFVGKDFRYLRDTFYPNLRNCTVTKMDNAKKTGAEGGTGCRMSEIDNKIVDIIGRGTGVVEGLESRETPRVLSGNSSIAGSSMEGPSTSAPLPMPTEAVSSAPLPIPSEAVRPPLPIPSEAVRTQSTIPAVTRHTRNVVHHPYRRNQNRKTKDDLEYEKAVLYNEYLRQMTLQLQLDNFDKERKLGLPHSELTKTLLNLSSGPSQDSESTVTAHDEDDNLNDLILEEEAHDALLDHTY